MSIQEIFKRFKGFFEDDTTFTLLIVLLVSVASFGLGRASVEQEIVPRTPITETSAVTAKKGSIVEEEIKNVPKNSPYVASKNGTKYHLPWCPGAMQMNEENKTWFSTKEAAEAAGYTPAANCKGI